MPNLTPEQEQEIEDNIKKYGSVRPLVYVSDDDFSRSYNQTHGTNFDNEQEIIELLKKYQQ